MTDRKEEPQSAKALEMAALIELIALSKQLKAAIIRGEGEAAQSALRGRAHDTLDALLDQAAATGHSTLAMLDGHHDAAELALRGASRLLED